MQFFLIFESNGLHCKARALTSKHPVQRKEQSGADSVLYKGQDLLVMRPSSVTLLDRVGHVACLPLQYFLLGIAMCSAYMNGATIKGTDIVSAKSLMENRNLQYFC